MDPDKPAGSAAALPPALVLAPMLRELGDADPAFFDAMVGTFRVGAPDALAALDGALRAEDRAALEQALHRLKSSVGNWGQSPLFDLVREVQGHTADHDWAALRAWHGRFLAEFPRFDAAVSALAPGSA